MKHWWTDTLFKRLFLLMWVALVASHIVAVTIVSRGWSPDPGRLLFVDGPGMPSLPPTPGLPRLGPRELGDRGPLPDMGPPPGGQANGRPDGPRLRGGLSTPWLLLDYGIRFLVIGLASWWGARWLSAPTRRLVTASHALASSVGKNEPLPALDETLGTVEVREAAEVFNDMARQLDSQFRSRGLLVAAISHDLRTPLTRMRIRLESLQHETAAQRCVTDIQEMNELIDGVLEIFRSDGFAEPVRTTDVLALVQALTDDLAEQGHDVLSTGTPALVEIQPGALRRVLSNLLSNALRYGERADVEVIDMPDGVVVAIDDAGPGIPDALIEAVFQPFYAIEGLTRRGGGTGLGLYIARDLVQRQGGRLTLANRPEGGLRATVFVPHRQEITD